MHEWGSLFLCPVALRAFCGGQKWAWRQLHMAEIHKVCRQADVAQTGADELRPFGVSAEVALVAQSGLRSGACVGTL